MASFNLETDTSIHTCASFMDRNNFFVNGSPNAKLVFQPNWLYVDPMGLAMLAAWGAWCKRTGKNIEVVNLNKRANYAARMKVFDHLGVSYKPEINEKEEAGRFMPIRNVKNSADISSAIADVSVLLHLEKDTDALSAVQYCLSELLRNVLEHSSSPEGAFVCAHNYSGKGTHRVTLAVADCGIGITKHLGQVFPEVLDDDLVALQMSMSPGVTGAKRGLYGTTENAGAGLFITRCIAKGIGGYFVLISGNGLYRLRRSKEPDDQLKLWPDPFLDRSDKVKLKSPWNGTVVALEVPIDKIAEFQSFFEWVRSHLPPRKKLKKKIQFTES